MMPGLVPGCGWRSWSRRWGVAQSRVEVRVGRRPYEELARLAEELRADLLVIGSRGERQGIWRLLGSTAEHAVRLSPISVLLARGLPAEGVKTIVVALDESEVTPLVLQWASRLARRFKANVVAVHVVHRFVHGPTLIAASPSERQRAEEQLRRGAEQWLREQIPATDGERWMVDVAFGDAGWQSFPPSTDTKRTCWSSADTAQGGPAAASWAALRSSCCGTAPARFWQ